MYDEHFGVYGVRKVWCQLRREGVAVARCTAARLMRRLGLQGAVRGRWAKTTRAVVQGQRPDDRVNREFKVSRPNALWVSDLTYVATWRGFAYTAFVIDAYARRIVGWRVSNSLHTDLALDALEQALHERCAPPEGLIHHSDSRFGSACWPRYIASTSFAIPPSCFLVGARASCWRRPTATSRASQTESVRWGYPCTRGDGVGPVLNSVHASAKSLPNHAAATTHDEQPKTGHCCAVLNTGSMT